MDLTVDISGHSERDIVAALEEVLFFVRQGYRARQREIDTRTYTFAVKGEPIACYALATRGSETPLSETTYADLSAARLAGAGQYGVAGLNAAGEFVAMIDA